MYISLAGLSRRNFVARFSFNTKHKNHRRHRRRHRVVLFQRKSNATSLSRDLNGFSSPVWNTARTDRQTDRQGDRLRQDYTDKRWTTLSTVVASFSFLFSLSFSFSLLSQNFAHAPYTRILVRVIYFCIPHHFSPLSRSHVLRFAFARYPRTFASFTYIQFTYIRAHTSFHIDSHNKALAPKSLSFFSFLFFFPLCFFSSSM